MKQKLLFTFFLLTTLGLNTVYCQTMGNIAIAGISASYVYTGTPIIPAPVLRDGIKTLKKDVDYTLTSANNLNVGTATVTIKGIGNYTGEITREFRITKARLVATVDGGQTKMYGTAEPKLAFKITSGELKGTDALKGNLERQPGEDVGVYVISQGTLSAGDNYELMVVRNNFKIERAAIKVKPLPGQNKIYGQATPELKYTITEGALVGKDELTGTVNIQGAGQNVGAYVIAIGTLSAGKNYDVKFEPGSFEVLKADIAIKPNPNQSKVFGAPDPVLSYTITSGQLFNGDTFRGALGRQAGEDVGKYAIQQGTLTLSNNYNLKVDLTEKFEIIRKAFQ